MKMKLTWGAALVLLALVVAAPALGGKDLARAADRSSVRVPPTLVERLETTHAALVERADTVRATDREDFDELLREAANELADVRARATRHPVAAERDALEVERVLERAARLAPEPAKTDGGAK